MVHRMQRASVCDIAALNGPPLELIIQHACSKVPAQELHNLLSASKALRSAVLEHGAGTAELTYTLPQSLEQVEALAAWLANHGHLLGFLDFNPHLTTQSGVNCTQEERLAAEKAVASAFSKAASAVAHRGGLQLQFCKLQRASPQVAHLLNQLPSHCLTRLELRVLTPDHRTAAPSPYIAGLSNCLQHLTSLRELSLAAGFDTYSNRRPSLDPLLQQLSALTKLTNLALGDSITDTVSLTDNLRQLPASLKSMFINFNLGAKPLNLRHLTALTRLEVETFTQLERNHILPPNLLELSVGDVDDVACLLPLNQLKVLSLQQIDMWHPVAENLQQLSRLTSLESVDLDYQCERSGAVNNAADAWQFLPIDRIRLEPYDEEISANAISQLGTLTKLTGLALLLNADCTCETLSNFPRALCKLTQLRQLLLGGMGDWQNPGKAGAGQLDPVFDAMGQLQQLEDLCIGKMPISHKAARHLAESLACQLTTLTLCGNIVDDCDVKALILASPRLVNLSLAYGPLTDDILPVIASTCTGLTHLCCSLGTNISGEGVELHLPHIYHSGQQEPLPELTRYLWA